jgi:hypothetical protein
VPEISAPRRTFTLTGLPLPSPESSGPVNSPGSWPGRDLTCVGRVILAATRNDALRRRRPTDPTHPEGEDLGRRRLAARDRHDSRN